MSAPRQRIGELLGSLPGAGRFVARRLAPSDGLRLHVEGVGRIRFPVSSEQAAALCELAVPAHYGKGEETLLDRRVRDTWEVPRSRVEIDQVLWERTLSTVLGSLRGELGLPQGADLRADLHSMLVYAPGQFFLPHRDSERDDDMVGTLVVTLPSSFQGGAFVIEHKGERVSYGGSKKKLFFVAFYADCRHEVRPVREGFRVVLTYNLRLRRNGIDELADGGVAESLQAELHTYFASPRPPRWHWQEDQPPREPPNRLVYLLDHAYTERSLAWQRLKGCDAARAATLRRAADLAGCEAVLALAEIQETWHCMESGWDDSWSRRHRRWQRDADDEWSEEDPQADGPDDYDLLELIDGGITLDHWVTGTKEGRAEKDSAPILTSVDDEEVCYSTPTVELAPYASEYEGYMGNYGNTMDRWYRRAAIVLWPQERTFAIRAEASPEWALDQIRRQIAAGEAEEARKMVGTLVPFWAASVSRRTGTDLPSHVLEVAKDLGEGQLATTLLEPFRVEDLRAENAPSWAALTRRYGAAWIGSVVARWNERSLRNFRQESDSMAWIAAFPSFCEALLAADEPASAGAARPLWSLSWDRLKERVEAVRNSSPRLFREGKKAELGPPILGILESAATLGEWDLSAEAVRHLSARVDEPFLSVMEYTLRQAAESLDEETREAIGLDVLEARTIEEFERLLAEPAREPDDWSIALPAGCDCELCGTLAEFLADADFQQLEWPIAEAKRQHVHRRIDAHALPVRHKTRRSGRPYTLVLTKTRDLFAFEASQRQRWQAALDWLSEESGLS